VIQVIMVAIVIGFPQLVTGNLDKLTIDPSKVKIEVPTETPQDEQQETAPPDFGTPQGNSPQPGGKSEDQSSDDLQKQFGGK
jgi:hypothetical protein